MYQSLLYFNSNFPEILQKPALLQIMPNRRQTITPTNDSLVWWHTYASLGLNVLKMRNQFQNIRIKYNCIYPTEYSSNSIPSTFASASTTVAIFVCEPIRICIRCASHSTVLIRITSYYFAVRDSKVNSYEIGIWDPAQRLVLLIFACLSI